MGEEVRDLIMSNIRRDILTNTLSKGTRFDGRSFDALREAKVQVGVLDTAEGSALAQIGETKVLAAVKFDVVKPFSDRPTEGVFVTNAELLPSASPSFEPGPPDENSIELARVVDRAIRSAEVIDVKKFYLAQDQVLGLYLDIYVLNHAGNYTDVSTLAATAALLNTKIPRFVDGKLVRNDFVGNLEMTGLPLTTHLIKVGDHWLVDPSRDEERVAETILTIGTTETHVCAIQKGKGSLYKEELMDAIEVAFKRSTDLRNILLR
jgi:exosome complex component RRP42